MDDVTTTIQNNIAAYAAAAAAEHGDVTLPAIALYKKGYYDVFNLFEYPAILVSFDNRERNEMDGFQLLTVDVVLVLKYNDADELNKIALVYSDALYNLLTAEYKLGGKVINTEIIKEDHFAGPDMYLVDYNIQIEREV